MNNPQQHNSQIRLSWITHDGCEWLTKQYPLEHVTKHSASLEKRIISRLVSDYYLSTAASAKQLVDGWRRNGEDVSLFMIGQCTDVIIERMICEEMDLLDPI